MFKIEITTPFFKFSSGEPATDDRTPIQNWGPPVPPTIVIDNDLNRIKNDVALFESWVDNHLYTLPCFVYPDKASILKCFMVFLCEASGNKSADAYFEEDGSARVKINGRSITIDKNDWIFELMEFIDNFDFKKNKCVPIAPSNYPNSNSYRHNSYFDEVYHYWKGDYDEWKNIRGPYRAKSMSVYTDPGEWTAKQYGIFKVRL